MGIMEGNKLTYEELEHYYNSTVGLWAIDRSPLEVSLNWIIENAFQLGIEEKHSNFENIGKNMNRQTIENKAKEQAEIYMAEAPYQSGPLGSYRKGFIEGANWRINSVWHDPRKEEPAYWKLIIRKDIMGDYDLGCGIMPDTVSWAYVDDFLPDGKEEQQ